MDATIHRAQPAMRRGDTSVRSQEGELLALGSAAAAIACLPLLVPKGPFNSAPVDLLIAASVWLGVLWASATRRRLLYPYLAAATLYFVAGAIGALAGPVTASGAQALAQDLMLIVWCWTIVNVASSSRRLGVLLQAWVVGAVASAALLFVGLATGASFLTGQTATDGSRTSLTLSDPNLAASYLFVSIMLVWATGRPRRRDTRLAVYALLVGALLTTGSNEGILALGIGVAAAILGAVYRRGGVEPAFAGLALVVGAVVLAVVLVPFGTLQERASESSLGFVRDGIGRLDQSAALRGPLLEENIRMFQSGGILGAGPVSTKVRLEKEMAPFAKEAHNDYLAALNERGLLGLLGVIILVAGVVLRAAAVVRLPLEPGAAAVIRRPEAMLGAVVGIAITMSIYELLHVRHVWTLFALVAAAQLWGTGAPRRERA